MAVDDTVEKKSRRRRNKGRSEETEGAEEAAQEEARGLSEGKGRATPGKRNRQGVKTEQGRGNFLTRNIRGLREYLRGVQDELDKVAWPTREEMYRLTRIVLAVTVSASIFLGILAFLFTQLFAYGLRNNNEWVFLAFGVGVAAIYFLVNRMYLNGSDGSSSSYR